MRLLLDENFPADFAAEFTDIDVLTVHSLGWSGIKNGELLRRAKEMCDVFVTLDRNLEFQQNTKILPFGIIVVRAVSNRMTDLRPYVADIAAIAHLMTAGTVQHVGFQGKN
jgi:hypothetical protein